MADKFHLEVLRNGVRVWNQWRENNPQILPDLSHASIGNREENFTGINFSYCNLDYADLADFDLRESNFYKASLEQAELCDSNLSYAIFTSSKLCRAYMSCSNLSYANFRDADLAEVNFVRANLEFANFSGASLEVADLTGASLNGANFENTYLYDTKFIDANLQNVRNLEACEHGGISYIDYRTILQSKGIPPKFLRGCGLPDKLINFYLSIVKIPKEFNSCFISYSNADEKIARKLYSDLQMRGVRCWFAPENLKIGERIRSGIDKNIDEYDKLLLIISRSSINSQWVEQEVEMALKIEREQDKTILFPIKVDDSIMNSNISWSKFIMNTRNIGDFTNWESKDKYKESFERLLHDLKI